MLECHEIRRWHNLAQVNCRGLVSVIEGANIRVLQCSESSQGWEMGDIQCELGSLIVSPFFSPYKAILFVPVFPEHYIVPCRAHRFGSLCYGTNSRH